MNTGSIMVMPQTVNLSDVGSNPTPCALGRMAEWSNAPVY